ncbi:hypothetical protein PG984_005888 [Apiospora sp. TS-2023a]
MDRVTGHFREKKGGNFQQTRTEQSQTAATGPGAEKIQMLSADFGWETVDQRLNQANARVKNHVTDPIEAATGTKQGVCPCRSLDHSWPR